ncbi:dihydrofolate reductase family protein [Streptomyces zagrosensis]|uniref:Dihydrofolate reductase n=1 Tax=Streptomyces zagrosensis TaxID=1042984 RepID=A0A7W9QG16_9ACTN|nr:dihydrofolate reductase family protein [Streptomyces zagrosensis]MBB5939578.1 dihydrofolate reductase [Streptomyces zagrosensis]
MRTFKLQVQTSVDGYMASPDGEMDWMTFSWTDDINAYVTALTEPVDCMVLSRKLAEGFIPHWAAQPESEPGVTKMHETPKVVISDSLTESPWENTVVAGGDLTETITKLKAQPGGDMIAYGGGTLVADLIARNLFDELHLFVNPTAIGAGIPVFPALGTHQHLRLVGARPFDCGITALHYAPKGD